MQELATNLTFTANDRASSVISGISGKLGDLVSKFGGLGALLGGGALASFGKEAISAGTEIAKYRTQLELLTGSATKAAMRISEMQDLESKSPFDFTELAAASRQLELMTGGLLSTGDGFRMVTDAAAASGQKVDTIAQAFGTMYANLQAGKDDGGRAIEQMKQMGLITGDTVKKLKDMADAGASPAQVWDTLTASMNRYIGAGEKMAAADPMRELGNAWDDILETIGQEAIPGVTAGVKAIGAEVKKLADDGTLQKVGTAMGFAIDMAANSAAKLIRIIDDNKAAIIGLGLAYGTNKLSGLFAPMEDAAKKVEKVTSQTKSAVETISKANSSLNQYMGVAAKSAEDAAKPVAEQVSKLSAATKAMQTLGKISLIAEVGLSFYAIGKGIASAAGWDDPTFKAGEFDAMNKHEWRNRIADQERERRAALIKARGLSGQIGINSDADTKLFLGEKQTVWQVADEKIKLYEDILRRNTKAATDGTAPKAETKASGLPASGLADTNAEAAKKAQEEADKQAQILAKQNDEYNRYQQEMEKTRISTTSKLITLNQGEYESRRYTLLQEIRDLDQFAGHSEEGAKLVSDYWNAANAKIDQDEAKATADRIERDNKLAQDKIESAQRVADAIAELDSRMSSASLGRFEKERASVQADFLARSRSIAEQRARGDITSDQEQQMRDKLNQWRDYEFRRIGEQSGANFSSGWNDGIKDWLDKTRSGFEMARDLATSTAQAMSSGFSDFFFDVMTGKIKKLSDYITGFLTSIARAMANVMGEMAARQLITGAMGMFSSGTVAKAPVTGSNGSSMTMNTPSLSMSGAGTSMASGYANGGLIEGGFRAFATGGVVSKPTLGLIGEGRYNEAVVPLPDGKALPVVMRGGTQQSPPPVTINIINQTGQPASARASQPKFDGLGRMIIDVVLDGLNRNVGGLRDAVGAV